MLKNAAPLALVVLALCLVAMAGSAPRAAAGGRLRADVYLVQKKIPKSLTEKALLGFARGNHAKILRETTDPDLAKRQWQAEMVVAFNQPPGDLEYHVLFFDVQGGGRRFVDDMGSFISDRKQRTFVQKLKLDRPRFQPNRNMELVVTVKRSEVGGKKFAVAGEEVKRTGVVNFSDEDARKRD